jgi:hypothetical protein
MGKSKLRAAEQNMRAAFHDLIAEQIVTTTDSYAAIGAKLGCCETTVYTVARLKGLSRIAAKDEEVTNGDQ